METMGLIAKIVGLIIIGSVLLFLYGCKPKKPVPNPEPEPEPDTWEHFYPGNCIKGTSTKPDYRWQAREVESAKWFEYEDKIAHFMKLEGRENIFNALTLATVLTIKIAGSYFFKWTSDMITWLVSDYWAHPYEFVIEKAGRGDCEDFAGVHCAYLHRECKYWLVWWIEIYWQQRSNGVWKGLGHAITIFKETQESPWRCFSNQQYLGMSYGYADIADVVSKFCPKDDNHKLIKVVARHPMDGYMLWQTTTGHGNENMQLTVKQLKRRIMTRRRTRNG